MAQYGMAIDLRRCAGCGACIVACQMQNGQKPGVSWNELDCVEWGSEPGSCGRAYIPHACMQCDNPLCVEVCPTGASMRDSDGIILVSYDACIACGACIAACPYDAREVNDTDGFLFGASEPAPYEAYGIQRAHVVEKCTFCRERLDQGNGPACVVNCPGKARYFGDLEDPESPISQFLASHPETKRVDETSFYYLPLDGMPIEALPKA